MEDEQSPDIKKGLKTLWAEGITLSKFKVEVTRLLTPNTFDEDFWVWLYECYAEGRAHYPETIQHWAQEHFKEFTNQKQGTQLRWNKK